MDQWPALSIKRLEPNPSTHRDMGWGQVHGGVTPRSCQGQLNVTTRSNQFKTVENSLILLFFLQLCTLEMS